MNILVLGNGFDLAHGLETSYANFLDWVRMIVKIGNMVVFSKKKDSTNKWSEGKWSCIHKDMIYEQESIKDAIDLSIKIIYEEGNDISRIQGFLKKQAKQQEEFILNKIYKAMILNSNNNIWLSGFLKNDTYISENWIDFEKEMTKAIQEFDNIIKNNLDEKIKECSIDFLNNYREKNFFGIERKFNYTGKQLVNKLETDLNRLIILLEIYLCGITIDIDKMERCEDITCLKVDHVLSFNYTDIYERLYDKSKNVEYNYIHGKANIYNTLVNKNNNMVLGIREYLPDDRKNKDLEFISFKKYYQRIYKKNDFSYKEWIAVMENDVTELHNLFVFGHSLDITDGDIIKELILNDNVKTTIFYHSEKEFGKKISNLVRIIGQDELIRRTTGRVKKIIFKEQIDKEKFSSSNSVINVEGWED